MRAFILIFFFILSLFAASSYASIMKATELQEFCLDLEKSQLGRDYNKENASRCRGYLEGFFDSQIILEKLQKQKMFCIPDAVPRETNTKILNSWIEVNSVLAKDTTATVALLSAYKAAFPCKSEN